MNRRNFTQNLMGTVLSFSLLETLICHDALAKPIKPITDHWAKRLQEMCLDLKTRQISPSVWQSKIKELFNQVDLSELLQFIDFPKLSHNLSLPDLRVNTHYVPFPQLAGLPPNLAFYKKIFGMRKDRAVIPHGHKNMASCHLVLQGSLRVRHYEKLEEEKDHLIIRPSIDTIGEIGSHSSISDEENNVHWLVAQTNTAFTFDVIVTEIGQKAIEIHNIDIYKAERINNNYLRAPKLEVETALKKYGKTSHH